jgi:predicted HicB family RNase H-like nuclease
MNSIMVYKGYCATPQYSSVDAVFWGKLENISDSISFEGKTMEELNSAFMEAVDDYIDTCGRNGMVPKKPYKGGEINESAEAVLTD